MKTKRLSTQLSLMELISKFHLMVKLFIGWDSLPKREIYLILRHSKCKTLSIRILTWKACLIHLMRDKNLSKIMVVEFLNIIQACLQINLLEEEVVEVWVWSISSKFQWWFLNSQWWFLSSQWLFNNLWYSLFHNTICHQSHLNSQAWNQDNQLEIQTCINQ